MRVLKVSLMLGLFMMCSINASAAIFTEDWSSGSVNPSVWLETVDGYTAYGYGHDDISVVDPLGNGDYALQFNGFSFGGDPLWGDQITSTFALNRSDSLTITYKVWMGVAGGYNIGMWGGFWSQNNSVAYGSPEAVVGNVWNALRATEFGESNTNGVVMPDFNAALGGALNKADALTVRITLDPVQGAKWEWSQHGGSWTTERNTLGTGSGQSSVVCLGFAPDHGQYGLTMIDDIVVTPEPATLALLGIGALVIRRKRIA